jgi:hypothetical protein
VAFSGLQVQYVIAGAEELADDAALAFNTSVETQGTYISFNAGTGEISIDQPGNYYISWWISVSGSPTASTLAFELQIDGVTHSSSTAPISITQLSGSDFINITTTPALITLNNTSGDSVFLDPLAATANLSITYLEP